MVEWFKTLFRIVREYDPDCRRIHAQIDEVCRIVRERTEISVDVRPFSSSRIVVLGRYRENDYVQIFEVSHQDLHELVGALRRMSKFAQIREVDSIPEFTRIIKRELGKDW